MFDQYRSMIYFAVATLYSYEKDIIPLKEGEKTSVFMDNNKDILKRVCDEALSLFSYELDYSQVRCAIEKYSIPAQSIKDTDVATLN